MSAYFTGFILPDRAGVALRKMIDSGLWGEGDSEVLAHIALVAIQRAASNGLIELPPLDFEEDAEAPAPAPPCEHCDNGLSMPTGNRSATDCDHCGRFVEIPF